jgi:hypothetical protein
VTSSLLLRSKAQIDHDRAMAEFDRRGRIEQRRVNAIMFGAILAGAVLGGTLTHFGG